MTMPAPPPYGVSSTCRPESGVKSRKFTSSRSSPRSPRRMAQALITARSEFTVRPPFPMTLPMSSSATDSSSTVMPSSSTNDSTETSSGSSTRARARYSSRSSTPGYRAGARRALVRDHDAPDGILLPAHPGEPYPYRHEKGERLAAARELLQRRHAPLLELPHQLLHLVELLDQL